MLELTPADVDRWDLNAIDQVFKTAQGRADTLRRFGDDLADAGNTLAGWHGEGGDAFRGDLGRIRKDLDDDELESRRVALAVSHAEADIRRCKLDLGDCRAVADRNKWAITADWQVDTGGTGIGRKNDPQFTTTLLGLRGALEQVKADAHTADHELATALRAAVIDGPRLDDQAGSTDSENSSFERTRNQVDAFRRVYQRDPVSDNDWRMAAGLDPHSYDPKYVGVPPEIVAGRFTPQPGKGVVRTNMFIPADKVHNALKDGTDLSMRRFKPQNFGDNRGPSATAAPEASRVSMFVDYDHGVIVVRQNPTSNVDGLRGGAAAAVPNVHVAQVNDGRMTIDYNAHDAYENPVGTGLGWTVNGRVTLSPQADGAVALGGNTTIYPSMETYQYRGGFPTAEVQWTPANSGSEWGPMFGLPRHHWVGDTTIPAVRPDMPGWRWELENAMPFVHDPFIEHTTQLTDPFKGSIPVVGTGR
ncbi:MAG TPA: hypothetical protein VF299_03630 [Mycobacterium sp.]